MKAVAALLLVLLLSTLLPIPNPFRFMHRCMMKWEYSILLPTLTFFIGSVLFPSYIVQVFAASVLVAVLILFFYRC